MGVQRRSVGIGGLGVYFYPAFLNVESDRQRIALLLGVTGLFLALVSTFAQRVLKVRMQSLEYRSASRRDQVGLLVGEFMHEWSSFEVRMRGIAAARLGESRSTEPLLQIFKQLHLQGTLNLSDIDFRNVLQLRNDIVHGSREVDAARLTRSLQIVRHLNGRIAKASTAA